MDGELWAELDSSVAIESGLREGAAFSWEELNGIRVAGERPLAMTRALNLLGYRARSEGELRERLGRYSYAPETVEVVIGRLGELAYLDDEVFDLDQADATHLEIVGEGALLAALERSRTGRMADIVATSPRFVTPRSGQSTLSALVSFTSRIPSGPS